MVLTHYSKPLKKITVTHCGTDYQLEGVCKSVDVIMQENAAWNAQLVLTDEGADLYDNKIRRDDLIKIYVNYGEVEDPLTSASLRFHGFIEDMQPILTDVGELLNVNVRAYSRCLLDLVCSEQYGVGGRQSDMDTLKEILVDSNHGILYQYVNNLLATSQDSGYDLELTNIDDLPGEIRFLDYPYKPAKNAIDDLLDYWQALKGSSTAGCHYIVKPEESLGIVTNYFLLGQIENHGAWVAKWPHWWNTDEPGSTIAVKQDMVLQQFTNQRPEANHILYLGNMRIPGDGDYATEHDAATLWDDAAAPNTVTINNSDTHIVGDHSVLLEPANAPVYGLAHYPHDHNAAWDFETISTANLIPRLRFYMYIDYVSAPAFPIIYLATNSTAWGDGADDNFSLNLNHLTSLREDKWVLYDLPIGPHYALDPTLQNGADDFEWLSSAGAGGDWGEINAIQFMVGGGDLGCEAADNLYIDGLHFTGHIARSARKLTTSLLTSDGTTGQDHVHVTDGTVFRVGERVTIQDNTPDLETNQILSIAGNILTLLANLAADYTVAQAGKVTVNEFYRTKVIVDNVAKDDSTVATDDSGTMARIAYAELLRAARSPITGQIVIPGKPTILPGQMAHIHAVKTSAGTFRIDKKMRISQHHLQLGEQGLLSMLTLTDDVYNSRPLSPNSGYALIRRAADLEYQNRQISSVKTWNIDTTQTLLEKTYSFASSY